MCYLMSNLVTFGYILLFRIKPTHQTQRNSFKNNQKAKTFLTKPEQIIYSLPAFGTNREISGV